MLTDCAASLAVLAQASASEASHALGMCGCGSCTELQAGFPPESQGERGLFSAFTFRGEPDLGFLLTPPFVGGGEATLRKHMAELQDKTEYDSQQNTILTYRSRELNTARP